ncbi:putative phosphatidylserine decarboxylase family protein [Rosellinia necatrix]|uniref:Putative phosphatidylserine decarboxylase family protein n=1 Tax=Rosellinia necatrix TaxID=77044 RepID=A0A1W2TVU3_ROSNE|nr:putative phosphatidylserine decarboxylase family protein [Rosellinia necatrix]
MVHQHGDEADIPPEHKMEHVGSWLPNDHRVQHDWMARHVAHVDVDAQRGRPRELIPVIREFRDLIESDARVYMYFAQMWDEVPLKRPYFRDPAGRRQIRDYRHMLAVLNHIFTQAPQWNDTAFGVGMVGVPMVSVFDYVMATPSGHAAFLDPESPESAKVLTEEKTGWFSPHGKKDLMEVANAPLRTSHSFEDMYVCDPKAKHHGYTSWDDFFTRSLRPGVRPVSAPADPDVVANACESRPYALARGAALRARFWVKGQPYSVLDVLGHDGALAPRFAGATVYQAFLSALSYHRWHSPVAGRVVRAFVRGGTYFSEPLFLRDDDDDGGSGDESRRVYEINAKGFSASQGYLTALAARAVIFIEADNPAIGLMAFVGVGMDEVSTCEITVQQGQHVEKGEQLGMFHFGGSSHCLLFREGVKVDQFPTIGQDHNVPVRSQVAVVKP